MKRHDPALFFKLFSLLRQRKPDILHSWGSMCSLYALPCVKLLRIKFVNGFVRGAGSSLSFRNKNWRRARLTFPFSDAIITNSKAGLSAYQAPLKKSYCIYNGFDMQRVNNLPDKEELKKRYGIHSKYVVGMVASFSASKDHSTFLKAAMNISDQREDTCFVMVGDGPTRAALEDWIPVKFRNKIRFLGLQQQVEEIVSIFTIGVLTSNSQLHGEGISNAIMEYMALEKPVIATDCGGNKEIIVNNTTGFLTPNGDSVELTYRINELLDHKNLATRFGQSGKQYLQTNFSLERLTQQHVSLYNKLIN